MEPRKLLSSFRCALCGIGFALRREQNFRIEILAAFFVFLGIFLLPLERWEIVTLVLAMMSVLILELLNTFLERLINILKPRIHPHAKVLKDIMAATVFVASVASAIVGIVIFWPYLVK